MQYVRPIIYESDIQQIVYHQEILSVSHGNLTLLSPLMAFITLNFMGD